MYVDILDDEQSKGNFAHRVKFALETVCITPYLLFDACLESGQSLLSARDRFLRV